jgi:predicted ribonuclease YlaK
MAKSKTSSSKGQSVPKDLHDHMFYGLSLDDEQEVFRDAIWNTQKKIIFANAKAGTGKTTVALGTANLLYEYGLYDGIVYIVAPTQEQKQGYLPGGTEQKTAPYMEPLYEAIININKDPNRVVVSDDNIEGKKNGTAFIQCMPHTFLRGTNFENKVVIIDEVQNFYLSELKKTLTRMHDSCKVIVIGHTGQMDLYRHPENSGFASAINLFLSKEDERVAACTLTHNHRGWISTVADELDTEISC